MTSDDNSERERIRAAAARDYEIDLLVVKTGIARAQACELVNRHGTDRETLIRHGRSLASHRW
jgi:hypothetical protein